MTPEDFVIWLDGFLNGLALGDDSEWIAMPQDKVCDLVGAHMKALEGLKAVRASPGYPHPLRLSWGHGHVPLPNGGGVDIQLGKWLPDGPVETFSKDS